MDSIEFDFEGQVHFLAESEGGRKVTPSPGYRSDFRYKNLDLGRNFMIWPLEFFTDLGEIPVGQSVPRDCFARFYILDRDLRECIHRERIVEGVEFEMLEGSRVVGVGVVTRLLSLAIMESKDE